MQYTKIYFQYSELVKYKTTCNLWAEVCALQTATSYSNNVIINSEESVKFQICAYEKSESSLNNSELAK